jgi:putative ABC transport system ATP-binding protein
MSSKILEAKNLKKNYQSGASVVKALNDISVSVKKGEFLMIIGKNGSGKSTFLHQLALLDKPDFGEIYIENQKVTNLAEKEKSKLRLNKLGYIFQEYALITELSVLENVMLPAMMIGTTKNAKERAKQLLKKIGLINKSNRLPSQLSGGEQQKVAIARSLINSPKIIFADEPTANLDTNASKEILNIFKNLNQKDNITIIMVTHEMDELKYASRKIKLSDGKLI